MIEEFERHLRGTNLSENTVTSYLFAVRQFEERHDAVTKRNLKEHKAWLIEQYKPETYLEPHEGHTVILGVVYPQ